MRHSIRLKEQARNRTHPAHPTPTKLTRSQGLEDIDFPLETDKNGFILSSTKWDPEQPSCFLSVAHSLSPRSPCPMTGSQRN